jgi:hypothetical protein
MCDHAVLNPAETSKICDSPVACSRQLFKRLTGGRIASVASSEAEWRAFELQDSQARHALVNCGV